MFRLDAEGHVKGDVNDHGWLAAGVPGRSPACSWHSINMVRSRLAHLVQPAIRYAADGFPVDATLKFWLNPSEANLRRDPGSARLFFHDGKRSKKATPSAILTSADLLQRLAERGSVDDFYHGEIARQIASAFKKNGGLVTEHDLASYKPLEMAPLKLDWRGHTIATAPLTAGGLTILQTIATLKALGVEWSRLSMDDPKRTQAWLEALRIAWGDRLRLFGDPRFVDVPVERLLSEKYADESAVKVHSAINQKRPVPVVTDGSTASGTVNLSVVDSSGMAAAMTLTHGDAFGAQVTVEGLGLILGHGMSRFEPAPGKLNSIAPGKRPLDNMCPSVVLKGGKPMMAIGAIGGRRIPNAVFQVLLKMIADGSSLEDAASDPRLHTEGGLELHVEPGRPPAEIRYLKQVGYDIQPPKPAFVSAVLIDPADRTRPAVGVTDYASERTTPPGNRNPQPTVSHSR